MTLQYSIPNSAVQEIIAKLKELSLAFDKQRVKDLKTTTLIDGKQTISGPSEILEHLLQIEGELHSWYYCDC